MRVVSSFYSDNEPRVNCHTCLKRYVGRDDCEKMSKKHRRNQGCFGIFDRVILPTPHMNFFSCIGNFKDPSYSYIITLCRHYKSGINPFGGNLTDVPNKIVEICNLIDNLTEEKQKEATDNGK